MAVGGPGHQAGQFAFAMSDRKERPHPYTIASAWGPKTRLVRFIVKALGDHTGRLKDKLNVGMPITMEGPYGTFDFKDRQQRQIWISAGIGITPFIPRMKQLAEKPDGKIIDFFHPTSQINQVIKDRLLADFALTKIKLRLIVDNENGPLDAERIGSSVPDW